MTKIVYRVDVLLDVVSGYDGTVTDCIRNSKYFDEPKQAQRYADSFQIGQAVCKWGEDVGRVACVEIEPEEVDFFD